MIPERPDAPPPDDARLRNRVLVVDDEASIRRLFQGILEASGFDVIVSSSGYDALRLLREDATIGLVLLDLMMPDMDGWGFRHSQRSDARLAEVPTVVVTGLTIGDKVRGELQAEDYLQKPVEPDHLVEVAARFCQARAE